MPHYDCSRGHLTDALEDHILQSHQPLVEISYERGTATGSKIAVGVEDTRLCGELAHHGQPRGELLQKVIAAQEDERKRIAITVPPEAPGSRIPGQDRKG